jgi:prepilin-type N-terminal cleavage/methylation domain-containing protein
MRSVSRQAFTLFELMVTVAVIGIVSSLAFRSAYAYLQEQHLRQAANEFVSYLLTARARALREGSLSEGKACEVFLEVPSDVSPKTIRVKPTTPTDLTQNACNGFPVLDLRANGGGSDLTTESISGDASYPITFTRLGTVASRSLSDKSNKPPLALPRIFYFSNSATNVRRCVMVDFNSLRMGWRNSKPTAGDVLCTYNGS